MDNNDDLFTDERNLLFVHQPSTKNSPFNYIFLHNDEEDNVRFVACFNLELSCFKICKKEKLPHSSDLWKKWEAFYTESLEAKNNEQVYHTQIDGETWKRIHIQALLSNNLFNCFEEFRNNIMNQSKNETV